MGFQIPNAGTASFIQQAEPDAVDIDTLTLGFADSGIVSGCSVTYNSVLTVTVAAGTMVWQGTNAAVAGGNLTLGAADPGLARFDLIVVNSSGTHSIVAGTAAAVPVFPAIPATSVPLASVYVPAAATTLSANNIIDKRILFTGGGYTPTSRTITATAPVLIDGTTVKDLSANRTLSLAALGVTDAFLATPKLAGIDVAAKATSGVGTSGSPWLGWDTATTWAANTTYYFRAGTYSYATSPNFGLAGIRLVGEGPTTILKYTGAANAVTFDGGSLVNQNVYDCGMEGFLIKGTSTATNGLFVRGIHHSRFRDIRITDVATTGAGLLINFSVVNTYDNIRISSNEAAYVSVPLNGVYIDRRAAAEISSDNIFLNCITEGVGGDGWYLAYAQENIFTGGTSESNSGFGVNITANANINSFYGCDLEANVTQDLYVSGNYNLFSNCTVQLLRVLSGASRNRFLLGYYNTILLSAGAAETSFYGTEIRNNAGTFTDSGTQTTLIDVWDHVAGAYLGNKHPQALVSLGTLTGTQLISNIATGTAPLVITSTTAVANLALSADTQLPTISTASKVSNSATTATSANTASAIVARDGSNAFSAGVITNAGLVDTGKLDVTQSVAFLSGTDLTLSNGLNSNIALAEGSVYRILGPTGAFSIGGLTGGRDGRMITLISHVNQTMTVVNGDASSSAGNKINCLNAANFVGAATAYYQAVTLIWTTVSNAWQLVANN